MHRKNIVHIGYCVVSGIHWGCWNIFPVAKGGTTDTPYSGVGNACIRLHDLTHMC